MMKPNQIIDQINKSLPGSIEEQNEYRDELQVYVKKEFFPELMKLLRNEKTFNYDLLLDIAGIDRLPDEPRFELVYVLFSLEHNRRLIVKLKVDISDSVPSMTGIWKSADWPEREVFDLLGINFSGHPDLRRILTWDNFEGHPLRKDFPLRGKDFDKKFDPDTIKVY
jgi:NADH-quinone oxidoreductase subunit C